MKRNHNYQAKPLFKERISKLLKNKEDEEDFWKIIREEPVDSIRCNTLKISPDELKEKLEARGWKIKQPFSEYPEIMIIEESSNLKPGELGKSIEHLLGYYYVQEISSMLPILALSPQENDIVLDLCAAPGSKTSQISAMMQNKGTIIANDKDIGRISILATNLERCGCTNVIITRNDAVQLCNRLTKIKMKFDKILLDVPCSGEGTLRSSSKTLLMWNLKMIQKLSRLQKKIAASAISLLKPEGTLVYSTCTHTPEENEQVVDFLAERFNMQVEKINLPVKCREGITSWENENFSQEVKNCCRIYPQDNNTEGFFVAKLKFKEEK
ncbi:MAG TPA: RsmB/NOP family class I SAM-dependent RNA methyltransferase [Candidatus Paceibacterota bacterium]|nr:RsmB/NOP family class I SAM-dependent RNA methyltransferase [Candidatus Paceibacterota bacterium]